MSGSGQFRLLGRLVTSVIMFGFVVFVYAENHNGQLPMNWLGGLMLGLAAGNAMNFGRLD